MEDATDALRAAVDALLSAVEKSASHDEISARAYCVSKTLCIAELAALPTTPSDFDDGRDGMAVVFAGPAMHRAYDTGDRDDETAKRLKHTLKRLRESGPARPLRAPLTEWRTRIDQLSTAFPNFRAAIDGALRPHLAICDLGLIRRLPPMLLVGPPGVGKTHFAFLLAEILRVPMQLVSFASATSPSALAGSSPFWGNSNPGELFARLAWPSGGIDAVANPLLLLDEIDKVSPEHRYDPLGALYTLLEISTAKVFEDEGLPGVSIDTSYVSYIATANTLDQLPTPIRSRLTVYEIEPPTPDQARSIAKRIFADAAEAVRVEFSTDLPNSVLDDIGDLNPREMKTRLNVCIGLAIYAGRRHVEPSDWYCTRSKGAARLRIGFS